MDADSSYGGSDTAQDFHSGHENNSSSLETTIPTHLDRSSAETTTTVHGVQTESPNTFYHKNEITLPVNYDETDFANDRTAKQPHYMSTANLNINDSPESQSNLEEMSRNYKSTNYLNAAAAESPKGRKRVNSGFDNPAFLQDDDRKTDANGAVKSTFDHNKPYNGDLNSTMALGLGSPTKGDEPMTEAVNLELINLKPTGKDVAGPYENGTNGMTTIPLKKVTEMEIGNPYDEYFVPVNEHRKYMRGEKLYVTMDKRNTKKRNKCLCWGICLGIVAAAVILGILAAVGVIGKQDAHPIQEVSARHLGETHNNEPAVKAAGGIFGLPVDVHEEATTRRTPETETHPFTPGPSVSTASSRLPTTETSMIEVPQALESQLVIDNLQFTPELAQKNSTEHKRLAEDLENNLKKTLFNNDVLNYGAVDINVKIVDFTRGSVVAKYRVMWTFKDGIHNPKDPIDAEGLVNRIKDDLSRNNSYINDYHISENTVTANKILDLCKIENNGCEYNCSFDYNKADFTCKCPEGKRIADDQKTCISEPVTEPDTVTDFQFINNVHTSPVPEPTSEPQSDDGKDHLSSSLPNTTLEPISEPEPTNNPSAPADNKNSYTEASPEPTPEPRTEPNHTETTQKSIVEPISQSEPIPEPTTTQKSETASHGNYVQNLDEHATRQTEITTTPISEAKPEPTAEPITESPITKSNESKITETTTQHKLELNADAIDQTITETTDDVSTESVISPKPSSTDSNSNSEGSNAPDKEPITESPVKSIVFTGIELTTEPVVEPTSEPVAEPTSEPVAEPTSEPVAEPTSEPVAEPTSEPVAEPTSKPITELTSEASPEPKTESDVEVKTEQITNFSREPKAESNTTPSPEPSVEDSQKEKSEQVIEVSSESAVAQTSEPVMEPTVTPAIDLQVVPLSGRSTETSGEPIAEPTTVANVESKTEILAEEPVTQVHVESSTTTTEDRIRKLTVQSVTEKERITTDSPQINIEQTVQSKAEAKPESTTVIPLSEKSEEPLTTLQPELRVANVTQNPSVELEATTKDSAIEITSQSASLDIKNEKIIVNNQTVLMNNETKNPETTTVDVSVNQYVESKADEANMRNETLPELKIYEITNHNVQNSNETVSTEVNLAQSSSESVTEPAESMSHLDGPSPFLPEIENDTLVNSLHLDEHNVEYTPGSNENETHDEEAINPPSLDNDQMNVTNPHDESNSANDDSLSVVPLETHNNANEIVDSSVSTGTSSNEPTIQSVQKVGTTTAASVSVIEPKVLIDPVEIQQEPQVAKTTTETPSESVTNKTISEERLTTLLPPEIINNVHSNNYFNQLEEKKPTELTSTTTTPKTELDATTKIELETSTESVQRAESINRFQDLNTRTEDLLALETTTNSLKINDNKNAEFGTESDKANETYTTVHAEMRETVTESVLFSEEGNSNFSSHSQIGNSTTKSDIEQNTSTANGVDETTTTQNEIATNDKIHTYQVQESTLDVTTTEKLFLIAKTTTTTTTSIPAIVQSDNDELSVIPLSKVETDPSKLDKKRLVDDNSFNQFESEGSIANDISAEEESVLDKFNSVNVFNNYNNRETTENGMMETTLREDNNDATTESDDELQKYDKIVKKTKGKFADKKAKLEKAAFANGELTTIKPPDEVKTEFADSKPVTEGFVLSGFSRCPTGQFQCKNGTAIKGGSYCIPGNDRCDSVDDCTDASDEENCVKEGCPNNFMCTSGQCLKRHLVCDGIQNCNDGSDEMGCEKWECRFDEFSCGGRCIPLSWKCDGHRQCPNGSDEHNCPSSMCGKDAFQCTEQDTCIPTSWRCDGRSDCMNDEDEKSCDCATDEFKCTTGGGCVKNNQRCDGIDHCPDRSDEWNCLRLNQLDNQTNYLQVQNSNNTWYPVCSQNWNTTHSDLICRSLGFAGATLMEATIDPNVTAEGFYRLKSETNTDGSILSQLELTNNCNSSIVSLSCQEFECGSQSSIDKQTGRIIGGNRSAETQWPSLTLLYDKKRNVQCTATLIAPLWVVASYSCVMGTNVEPSPVRAGDWVLYAGSTKFFNNADNSTTQVRPVKRIISHPQAKYAQFEFVNDIVLVELLTPLTLTRNVSAVCLPENDMEPRQLCVISGWGISKPGDPNKEQYLNYLPVPIIDATECNSTKHYNGLISDDKICAGYTDSEKSPCYNDEGAPLMCFSDSAGIWEIQGLLSYQDNCGRNKHPALYTRIATNIRQWIINTVGQKPSRSA